MLTEWGVLMGKLKRTKALFIVITSSLVLAGCQAIVSPLDKEYQFGDFTKSTLEVRSKYCSESDPVKRAFMLTAIKSVVPPFPASGACTSLFEVFGEDVVREISKDVDLEQALEDQRKYKNE